MAIFRYTGVIVTAGVLAFACSGASRRSLVSDDGGGGTSPGGAGGENAQDDDASTTGGRQGSGTGGTGGRASGGTGGSGTGGMAASGGTPSGGTGGTMNQAGTGGTMNAAGAAGGVAGGGAGGTMNAAGAGGDAGGAAGAGGDAGGAAGAGGDAGGAAGMPGSGGIAAGPRAYDFETGVQNWASVAGDAASVVSNSSETAFAGTMSAAVAAEWAGPGPAKLVVGDKIMPPQLIAGEIITLQVWFPEGAPIKAFQPFMSGNDDMGGNLWHGAYKSASGLTAGAWNELRVTAPANVGPIDHLGLQISLLDAWTGTLFLDEVQVSAPEAPPAP